MDSPTAEVAVPVLAAILTAVPTTMEEGKTLVWFRRKKVPDSQMYRAAFVPAWEQPEEVTKLSAVYKGAVDNAIRVAAGNILRKHIEASKDKDSKETLTHIDVSLLTFPAVVAEMEATQVSEKLDGDTIAAWYDASKTKQDREIAYNDAKKATLLRDKFLSLASNNSGILPQLAEKMISYISTDDVEHAVCGAVIARLDRIKKTAISSDEL